MQGNMGGGMMGMRGDHHAFGFGDPSAHLATLKTDLGIKPEQTAAWDTYAKVVQDTAQQMQATRQGIDRDAVRSMSPQDRQAFMTKMRDQHVQAFATVKTAAQTLLPSLDDAQKAKAQSELPGLAAQGRHMMRHVGMGMMGGPAAPAGQ
ncbi:MAG: Spy/CpxP family protein refolding chaperone [Acetobacteraceae bacterium]|nr:Spy/CpxP family protein refolding chaperone [Acetobacteraceae bacterium]